MRICEYFEANRKGDGESTFVLTPRIYCADGFSLSVQANPGAYCAPRDGEGPWYQVEVGFPSATPELIMAYAEEEDDPTETVYAYVPIELVDELIALHGGIANKDGARPTDTTP